jgi:hypothetical protein
MHHPAAGPTGRCPVQPSTPLGPDQVNVLLLLLLLLLNVHPMKNWHDSEPTKRTDSQESREEDVEINLAFEGMPQKFRAHPRNPDSEA